MQKLEGDGMAFVHAGGAIHEKHYNGEVLRVDTGCLVAMTSNVDYDIEMVGGVKLHCLVAKESSLLHYVVPHSVGTIITI